MVASITPSPISSASFSNWADQIIAAPAGKAAAAPTSKPSVFQEVQPAATPRKPLSLAQTAKPSNAPVPSEGVAPTSQDGVILSQKELVSRAYSGVGETFVTGDPKNQMLLRTADGKEVRSERGGSYEGTIAFDVLKEAPTLDGRLKAIRNNPNLGRDVVSTGKILQQAQLQYADEAGRSDQANFALMQKVQKTFGTVSAGTVGAYVLAMADVKSTETLRNLPRGTQSIGGNAAVTGDQVATVLNAKDSEPVAKEVAERAKAYYGAIAEFDTGSRTR